MMKATAPCVSRESERVRLKPDPTDVTAVPRAESAVIAFPAGIPGFESCRRFVLVTAPELAPFAYLNALDPPAASFLTIDPSLLDPAYDKTLRDFERARLNAPAPGARPEDALLWLAIVTVGPDGGTANLRAPVVINPRRMVGCQFIRDESEYPVNFPIGG
jgi:flagellar assembly factor FliW